VYDDPSGVCQHSIYERLDTWYKGPLFDPYCDKSLGWTYAINAGGGPLLTRDERIWFSGDVHYWFDEVDDMVSDGVETIFVIRS
jgi:hypothetical protein